MIWSANIWLDSYDLLLYISCEIEYSFFYLFLSLYDETVYSPSIDITLFFARFAYLDRELLLDMDLSVTARCVDVLKLLFGHGCIIGVLLKSEIRPLDFVYYTSLVSSISLSYLSMPSELFIAAIILLLVLIGLVIYLIAQTRKPQQDQGSLQMLQQQLLELQKGIDGKLGESNRMLQEQFKSSNESLTKNQGTMFSVAKDSTKKIEELTEKLVRLEETNKQIMGIGDQLK